MHGGGCALVPSGKIAGCPAPSIAAVGSSRSYNYTGSPRVFPVVIHGLAVFRARICRRVGRRGGEYRIPNAAGCWVVMPDSRGMRTFQRPSVVWHTVCRNERHLAQTAGPFGRAGGFFHAIFVGSTPIRREIEASPVVDTVSMAHSEAAGGGRRSPRQTPRAACDAFGLLLGGLRKCKKPCGGRRPCRPPETLGVQRPTRGSDATGILNLP